MDRGKDRPVPVQRLGRRIMRQQHETRKTKHSTREINFEVTSWLSKKRVISGMTKCDAMVMELRRLESASLRASNKGIYHTAWCRVKYTRQ
jgi:hypothetical protein